IFTPYESEIKGNPAIQSGDMIVQVDKNGKEYNTIVTKMVYKYRGRSSLEAKGLPNILKGYKGSTNRKLAEIRRKIDVEVGDIVTDLEQAILEATELITGELGGYVLKRENELLIMDNPDPDLAVKVWRWNLGGLGYSSNGVNGTYELAMTMNGAINANFITTGLLSANMVRTGTLTSTVGNSWFNLDTGELRISHGGTEYSQVDINGFGRKWLHGDSSYVSDLYIIEGETIGYGSSDIPYASITLPQRFRGRTLKAFAIPAQTIFPEVEGALQMDLRIDVIGIYTGGLTPYVDVEAQTITHKSSGRNHRGAKFTLIVLSQ
ncbi:MAG TPA: hypothetical protein VFC79_09975, partial [Tissierellaceae bacterium]|nr:hypothetical protein [Tissierellaceae bacterium]